MSDSSFAKQLDYSKGLPLLTVFAALAVVRPVHLSNQYHTYDGNDQLGAGSVTSFWQDRAVSGSHRAVFAQAQQLRLSCSAEQFATV